MDEEPSLPLMMAESIQNYINIMDYRQITPDLQIVTVEFMIKPPGGRKWGRVVIPFKGNDIRLVYWELPDYIAKIRSNLGDFTGDRWEQK